MLAKADPPRMAIFFVTFQKAEFPHISSVQLLLKTTEKQDSVVELTITLRTLFLRSSSVGGWWVGGWW
jgi:hypothetical protein